MGALREEAGFRGLVGHGCPQLEGGGAGGQAEAVALLAQEAEEHGSERAVKAVRILI